jgi:hypothetical protein
LATVELSAEAKSLMIELRGKPEFFEILDSIRITKPPLYKPVRTNDNTRLNPSIQKDNWLFDSGAYHENMRIINKFSGENT